MARASFSKGQLISEIAESTGYKSGLSFSYKRMLGFVSKESERILNKNAYSVIGLRPEEYEEMYFEVLRGMGYAPEIASPYMQIFFLDANEYIQR